MITNYSLGVLGKKNNLPNMQWFALKETAQKRTIKADPQQRTKRAKGFYPTVRRESIFMLGIIFHWFWEIRLNLLNCNLELLQQILHIISLHFRLTFLRDIISQLKESKLKWNKTTRSLYDFPLKTAWKVQYLTEKQFWWQKKDEHCYRPRVNLLFKVI